MHSTLFRTRFAAMACLCLLLVLPGQVCVPASSLTVDTSGPTGSNATPGGQTGGDSTASEEDRVIALTNAARAAEGLPALRENALLAQAALGHATRMAQAGFFDHVDPGTGFGIAERADQVGYEYRSLAENIAAGQPTPEAVVDGWLHSPGHRANILSDIEDIGVGIYRGGSYRIYWVQFFGTPMSP